MSAIDEKPFTPAKGKKFERFTIGNVTVKIYRRSRPIVKEKKVTDLKRWIYEVEDKTAGVRRLRGFSTIGDARRDAKRICELTNRQGAAAAEITGPELASYGRAVEFVRPTGATLELAALTYARCYEILGEDLAIEAAKFYKQHRADRIEKKPVAAVVGELLASCETRGKSSRYIGDLRARLNRFAEKFQVDISTITAPEVQRWLDGLAVSAQTAKNFRAVLNRLFSFAEARHYIIKNGNPVRETERISANGGAIEIFTPDEISALLKAAKPDLLPFIAIGAFAGLRAAEIQRLEWCNVDLPGGFIHVGGEKAKTRSRRLVPILPNLARWLADYAKHTGKVWKGNTNDLQDARAECVKASGIAWKDNGLRHSFISYRLADVQSAAQVALEAGNSPAMVFKHYRELVKPEAAKAWFAVSPEKPSNLVQLTTVRP